MKLYYKKTVENYLQEVSSHTPVPGGGSVAALSGSLAASLNSMVCSFSMKEPKTRKIVSKLHEKSEKIRKQLAIFIDEDVKAYNKFSEAMKYPRNTEKQKIQRQKLMQKALDIASYVPLQTAYFSGQCLEISRELLKYGNTNLISDLGCAVTFARSAVLGASLNVLINLGSMKNEILKNKRGNEIDRLFKNSESLSVILLKEVRKRVKK